MNLFREDGSVQIEVKVGGARREINLRLSAWKSAKADSRGDGIARRVIFLRVFNLLDNFPGNQFIGFALVARIAPQNCASH